MTTFLPISDLAPRVGRHVNTVRLWVKSHRAHIERRSDERGTATYALEPLLRIRAMYDEGMSARQIERQLAQLPEPPAADPVLDILTLIHAELVRLRELIERQALE